MSDVLFRYLLTARQRERSTIRRLFLADDPLLEAGVEQLVETAAARVGVTSQHERVDVREVTVPASRRRSVRFYDVARPNRPREGHFEQRSEEFPLKDTLKVYRCTSCRGSGKVKCWSCSGRGVVRCGRCGGSGKNQGADGRRRTCGGCGGGGRLTCGTCGGARRVTCNQCRGEGRLASWDVEVYQWLKEYRSKDEMPLPADESRVRKAFDRWLGMGQEQVAGLEPAAVVAHLGFDTSEALEVAARADDLRRRLEKKAQGSSNTYLFHQSDLWIAPVGYTVVRLDGKARFYWLVGRGEQAHEVTPSGRPDGVKFLGWFGAGSGSLLGYESLAAAFEQALPVLESVQLFSDVPFGWLASGSVVGWSMALAGIQRTRRRKPPVPAIGLIVASGRPTAFLTCLAYLGSYLGRLKVLDRAYDLQSEHLLGRMRPNRQSESLGIEFADGRRIRLVEVANPQGISTERLAVMAKALDAIMILEQPNHAAAELANRIAAAANPAPEIGNLMIDDGLELGHSGVALPLEAIRRTFVEDLASDVDWSAIFDRMWQPLADLAEPTERSLRHGVGS